MKNIKIILTLVCFIAIPAYSQQSATTIDGLLERVEQGKINDALKYFKKALLIDKNYDLAQVSKKKAIELLKSKK